MQQGVDLRFAEFAVDRIERGDIVVVPKGLSLGDPKRPIDLSDDSLMDWDRNSEH